MTNTLQKLEKKQYISIVPDPSDGRAKLVMLKDKGRQAHGEALQALATEFNGLGKDLGEKLFTDILPALQKIRQYMNKNRS
jgi:DNA-binding MarR family transcriptional regulator